jgi:hypothetical protein
MAGLGEVEPKGMLVLGSRLGKKLTFRIEYYG